MASADRERGAAAPGAAVVPFPDDTRGVDVLRLLPSPRSLAVALALLALAAGAYAGARTTSVFAVTTIDVRGLPPALTAETEAALRPLGGTSLLALDGADLDRRLSRLPEVRSFVYDRAFPHTLRVTAQPELAVAVLRRGARSWLVSERGRVLREVPRGARPALPRIWVGREAGVSLGATLADDQGARAARALALFRAVRFPARARTVDTTNGALTFILRSSVEIRLGNEKNAALKLAIARRILPKLGPEGSYVDVSVPDRPVAGPYPQVESQN